MKGRSVLVKHDKTIKSTGTPLCMTSLENELVMVDSAYIVYRIDRKTFSIVEAKRITANYEPHHDLYRGFSCARNYIAVTFAKTNALYLFDVASGIKKIGLSQWHVSQVESTQVCADNRILLSGGQDGKVYVYDLESVSLIGSLSQKPDYIAAISVGDNRSVVAASSFNKSITVHDLDKNSEVAAFMLDEVAQNLVFFDGDNALFAACRDGLGVVYDLKEQRRVSEKRYFSEWPTAISASTDRRHALVGTRDGYLVAINLKENSERFKIKLRDVGISHLHQDENHLFVSFMDGVTEGYSLCDGSELIKQMIMEQNYDKAREVLNQNELLFLHPVIEMFDIAWEDALEAVKKALLNDDLVMASNIASPFLFDGSKKEQFHTLMAEMEHVMEFKAAFDNKNYARAYELAEADPVLKNFAIYSQMEAQWSKVMGAVKVLLQNDPDTNMGKCNTLLKPFMNIPEKKKIAYEILQNAQMFIQAENAVIAKDYKEYFRLAAIRPFLKDTPMYQKLETLSHRVLEKVNDLIKHEQYTEAVKLAKASLHFAPIEEQLKGALQEVTTRLKFIAAIKADDLKTVYEVLMEYDEFSYLKEFILVDAKFKELLKRATDEALDGNAHRSYELLNFYFDIPYRLDRVAQVMKIAFLNEIRLHDSGDEDEEISWPATFKNYITLFSKDAELKKIAETIKKKEILEGVSGEGVDETAYRRQMIPASVLAFS